MVLLASVQIVFQAIFARLQQGSAILDNRLLINLNQPEEAPHTQCEASSTDDVDTSRATARSELSHWWRWSPQEPLIASSVCDTDVVEE
eukprot:m.176807 g.176807  ORF g.176807 m.176807 type:complete len:89 (+) comp16805_c0_seq13:762-1028(+)